MCFFFGYFEDEVVDVGVECVVVGGKFVYWQVGFIVYVEDC